MVLRNEILDKHLCLIPLCFAVGDINNAGVKYLAGFVDDRYFTARLML